MNTTFLPIEGILTNPWFKLSLILAYILVFFSTFLGNILVILVVIQRKMRSSTHCFLTNLAVSDLCVGLFCIFQHFSSLLQPDWPFGEILCKMYHFIETLSYTSSIFTMVIISVERYIAICYPIKAKNLLQRRIFVKCIIVVWILSAIICSPNFWIFRVIVVSNQNGDFQSICILQQLLYNLRFFNIVNALLLFFFPMLLISILYIKLALKLNLNDIDINKYLTDSGMKNVKKGSLRSQLMTQIIIKKNKNLNPQSQLELQIIQRPKISNYVTPVTKSCKRKKLKASILIARQRAIRLLFAVVLAFAICHFPIHLRKLIQDWYPGYNEAALEAKLATIATNLLMYINSGLNPILYALLSSKFRKSIKNLLFEQCFNNRKDHKSIRRRQNLKLKNQSKIGTNSILKVN